METDKERKLKKAAVKYAYSKCKYFLTAAWCQAKEYYIEQHNSGNFHITKKLDDEVKGSNKRLPG